MTIDLRKRRDQHPHTTHQRASGGEDEDLQTPLQPHHWGPDSQHAADHQEGSTETRLPSRGILIILQTSQKPLQMQSGENFCTTVWYRNRTVMDRRALQRVIKTAHLWSSLPITTGQKQHPGHWEGTHHHQAPHPLTAHTVHTPAVWQTLHECESKDNQTKNSLSTGHRATEVLADYWTVIICTLYFD